MTAKAEFILTAKDKVGDATRSAEKKLNDLAGTATKVVGAMAAIGGAFLVKGIIDKSIQAENAVKQLEARVKSTGGAAGFTTSELVKMAGSLQKVTTFGDETVNEMQGLLLTFTKISGPEFVKAQEAILNVSTVLGVDLKSAALQVGKALNDPVLGISALSRAGIQFSEAQKDTIKSLVETGRTADAQNIILDELEVQFGGAARAAKDTFGGALKSLGNAFGDLLEADSMGGATKDINELTELLQDPKTVQAAKDLTNALFSGFTKVASVVREIPGFITFVAEEMAKFVHGSADPLERVTDNIKKLEDELKALQEMEQQRMMNPGMLMAGVPKSEKIAEVTAELETLRSVQQQMITEANNAPVEPPEEQAKKAAGIAMKTPANDDFDPAVPGGGLNDQKIQDELERIRLFLRSKEEVELEAYLNRKQFILMTMEEGEARDRILEDLHKKHQDTLTELTKKGEKERYAWEKASMAMRAQTVIGQLQQITSASSNENKKMFKLNQKAAIASTLINTYEMATGAYKAMASIPYIGPVLGALAAAAAIAFGVKQVQAIKSQSFDGGGSASTGGATTVSSGSAGAAPAVPDVQQNQKTQIVEQRIIITGLDDRQYLKDVLEPLIKDRIENDDAVYVTANTAQASEMRRAS